MRRTHSHSRDLEAQHLREGGGRSAATFARSGGETARAGGERCREEEQRRVAADKTWRWRWRHCSCAADVGESKCRRLLGVACVVVALWSCCLLAVGAALGSVELVSEGLSCGFSCGVQVVSQAALRRVYEDRAAKRKNSIKDDGCDRFQAFEVDLDNTFGKERMNILAACAVMVHVLYMALDFFIHALKGLLQPRAEGSSRLLSVAVVTMLLNSTSAFKTYQHVSQSKYPIDSVDVNLRSVVVHLLSQSMRSIVVICMIILVSHLNATN